MSALPYRVKSTTVHRGYAFPSVFPCDCRGIGCEAFLEEIAEHVFSGGVRVIRNSKLKGENNADR